MKHRLSMPFVARSEIIANIQRLWWRQGTTTREGSPQWTSLSCRRNKFPRKTQITNEERWRFLRCHAPWHGISIPPRGYIMSHLRNIKLPNLNALSTIHSSARSCCLLVVCCTVCPPSSPYPVGWMLEEEKRMNPLWLYSCVEWRAGGRCSRELQPMDGGQYIRFDKLLPGSELTLVVLRRYIFSIERQTPQKIGVVTI